MLHLRVFDLLTYILVKMLKMVEIVSKYWKFWVYLSFFDFRDLLTYIRVEILKMVEIVSKYWKFWVYLSFFVFGDRLTYFWPFDLLFGQNNENGWNRLEILKSLSILELFRFLWPFDLLLTFLTYIWKMLKFDTHASLRVHTYPTWWGYKSNYDLQHLTYFWKNVKISLFKKNKHLMSTLWKVTKILLQNQHLMSTSWKVTKTWKTPKTYFTQLPEHTWSSLSHPFKSTWHHSHLVLIVMHPRALHTRAHSHLVLIDWRPARGPVRPSAPGAHLDLPSGPGPALCPWPMPWPWALPSFCPGHPGLLLLGSGGCGFEHHSGQHILSHF